MAHLLGGEGISQRFPNKLVFDNVTVGIGEGDRIGIVGRNGDGKSTLIKILSKELAPDSGRVTWRGGLKVGFLRQSDQISPQLTVSQAVVGDRPEFEWASDAKIRDVQAGLQVAEGHRRGDILDALSVGAAHWKAPPTR